jgi:hypothetical protein
LREDIEPLAAHPLNKPTEDNIPDVAVEELSPGLGLERKLMNASESRVAPRLIIAVRVAGREPARVEQELLNRHAVFAILDKIREVVGDPIG